MKRLTAVLATLVVGIGLVGCSTGANLPEGDVKVIQQNLNGIVGTLLESLHQNEVTSAVASMVVPVDHQYELALIAEEFENGELVSTETILTHTTSTLTRDSIIHFVMHAGHGDHQSMFSIAEADLDSEDLSNPDYLLTTASYQPIFTATATAWTYLDNFGGELTDEIILAVYVSSDNEEGEMNAYTAEEYRDRSLMAEYEKATLIRAEVTQK